MAEEMEMAPDFELTADDGSTVRLSELRGTKVILYFYPRADTPGCTVQACDFRDRSVDFTEAGAVILGVSPDTVEEVGAFREKFGLNFRLLADSDHQVAEQYGVWQEKKMFGNTYMGVVRTTFVIDEEGRISKIFRRVRPEGHATEILAGL